MKRPLSLTAERAAERSAAPATSAPCNTGDELAGKYRLLRKAGAGGMGEVWVAVNQALETPVAIKVIHAEAQSFGASERLLREARATAALCHPAIVRVFDYGVTDQKHAFIVMELLEGQSLRDLLQQEGRMTPERAVELLLPIVEGLSAAHARGIIHRDLKPDNIVLARDDTGRIQPKIVDFGVAKVVRSQAPGITGVTAVGTPEYMSPEQAYALDAIDERADIWALCIVLHELCTDEYVFAGETYDEVLRKVVDEPVASLVERGIDPQLWGIVERGLRKQREERWPCARELGQQLARWLMSRGITEDVTGASLRATWEDRAGSDPTLVPPAEHSSDRAPRPASDPPGVFPAVARATPSPATPDVLAIDSPDAAVADDSIARPDVRRAPLSSSPSTLSAPRTLPPRRRVRELAGAALAIAAGIAWTLLRPGGADEPGVAAAAIAAPMVEAPARAEARLAAPPPPIVDTEAAPAAITAVSTVSAPRPLETASTNKAPAASAQPRTAPSAKKTAPEEVDFGF